jgi:hypothetical protein
MNALKSGSFDCLILVWLPPVQGLHDVRRQACEREQPADVGVRDAQRQVVQLRRLVAVNRRVERWDVMALDDGALGSRTSAQARADSLAFEAPCCRRVCRFAGPPAAR